MNTLKFKMLKNGICIPTTGPFRGATAYNLPKETRVKMLKEVVKYYATPGRAYHNMNHISKMLRTHRDVFGGDPTDALFLSIIMHDSVYVPGQSPASEDLSIDLTKQFYFHVVGRKIPDRLFNDVQALITWTRPAYHRENNRANISHKFDVQRMLDLDLCAMSDPWRYFVSTQDNIDAEFKHLGTVQQRVRGAASFLHPFADRGFVYYSEEMQKHNAQAVRNLRALIYAIETKRVFSYARLAGMDPDVLAAAFVPTTPITKETK